MRHTLPEEIEAFRDARWRRESTCLVESVQQAERFVEEAGFTACLTDSRSPGPSLYVAVCGRRDVVVPRNIQKDPETSHAWTLKDALLRRGRVYYGKLARGKAMFLAPRMIPHFHAIWGVPRRAEKTRLSPEGRAILRSLRKEWESSTAELRAASGIEDRRVFMKAIDELQAALIVIPTEAVYEPKFTYIWGLAEERFPVEVSRKPDRLAALREMARCFLDGAGMTIPGELARVTGLSRRDAGLGNRALVKEGYALMLAPGLYRLANPPARS